MAAKSPADLKKEGEELKTLFAKIKKKQHNCAVLISKDGIVFEAHIKKSPDMMFKAAKAAGGAPKGAWGTITMDGQVLILDPINDKVPGNLTKVAKKFFGERGLKNRLEIKEPEEGGDSGSEAGEAEEQETAARGGATEAEEETGGDDGADGDALQAVKDKFESLEREIAALNNDKENVMYDGLQEVLKNYEWIIEEGDAEKATEVIGRLEGVLEDYAGLMAEKKPLEKRFDAIARELEALKNSEHGDAAGVLTRGYNYALANNEWGEAGRKLDEMEALVGENGGSGAAPVEEEEAEEAQAAAAPSETAEPPATGGIEDEAPATGKPEAETQSTTASEEGGAGPDPLQAVKDRYKNSESAIEELSNDTQNVMHSSLMDALKTHERMLEAGDPGNASDSMSRIEGVLADYEGLMAEKRPLLERYAGMARGIDAVKSGDNGEAASAIGSAERAYEYSVSNSEWVSAGLKLDEMQALVDEHGGGSPQVEEEEEEIQASESGEAPSAGEEEEEEIQLNVSEEDVRAEIDENRRKELKARLDAGKKEINGILRNKDSENARMATEALTAYAQAEKSGNMSGAEDALDKVDEVLEKARSEFSLTDNQRAAIMKELDKMEAELDAMESELED